MMNIYLSNKMPELSEHEINCMGSYTVSYFDKKTKGYVAAKYCSVYKFLYLIDLPDNKYNRTVIYSGINEHGYFSKKDKNNHDVSIYK